MPPSHGVTDDPVGETHWVVKNGIRFSAMPSFGARVYQENGCQGCHGQLDGPPSKAAKRFYPHAPALMLME